MTYSHVWNGLIVDGGSWLAFCSRKVILHLISQVDPIILHIVLFPTLYVSANALAIFPARALVNIVYARVLLRVMPSLSVV